MSKYCPRPVSVERHYQGRPQLGVAKLSEAQCRVVRDAYADMRWYISGLKADESSPLSPGFILTEPWLDKARFFDSPTIWGAYYHDDHSIVLNGMLYRPEMLILFDAVLRHEISHSLTIQLHNAGGHGSLFQRVNKAMQRNGKEERPMFDEHVLMRQASKRREYIYSNDQLYTFLGNKQHQQVQDGVVLKGWRKWVRKEHFIRQNARHSFHDFMEFTPYDYPQE